MLSLNVYLNLQLNGEVLQPIADLYPDYKSWHLDVDDSCLKELHDLHLCVLQQV